VGKRRDGSALEAHLDKSQGRPKKSPGSKPIAQKRPAQPTFSQSPCPSHPTLPGPDPQTATSPTIFMPRKATVRGRE